MYRNLIQGPQRPSSGRLRPRRGRRSGYARAIHGREVGGSDHMEECSCSRAAPRYCSFSSPRCADRRRAAATTTPTRQVPRRRPPNPRRPRPIPARTAIRTGPRSSSASRATSSSSTRSSSTAPAGTVTLKLKNASSIAHNVAIELDGEDQEGELVTDGDISEITVELKPGTYTYYCTPHKSIGMTGTLTVT